MRNISRRASSRSSCFVDRSRYLGDPLRARFDFDWSVSNTDVQPSLLYSILSTGERFTSDLISNNGMAEKLTGGCLA